ncbi:flagellar hook associated protein [Bdellovibrio bacteriovorus W]|nr:flagellar hook associated protein [Bdellovibrio bacteriovorus W]
MASGLPPNIVEQLMEAERIPVQQMEVQKTKQEDKLKLVNELETKITDITKSLGELTSTRGFSDKKFVSSDENVIAGKVDPEVAVAGEHTLEVVQLAENPGAMSNGFPDKNESQVGVGYIKFKTSEGTKEVYINGKSNTLEGVARQINAADVGVTAQVVEDRKDKSNPFKLMISGLETGDDKQVTFPKIYLLDGDRDLFFKESRPAKNAKVKVNGFEIEIPENKSTDLIPGVALDLKSAAPGKQIRMSVQENYEVISGKIKSFVEAYNGALDFIQKQSKLQASNSGTPRLGPLGGDGMIRSVESALRRIILNPQLSGESPIRRVGELGIEFNRNGSLDFKEDKFNKVLQEKPNEVAAFFRGDGFNTGFVATIRREVGSMVNGSFGTVSNRKRGLQDRISQVNTRIENKERQLERKEDSLRRKFADLEQKMSDLGAQQARVAAMGQG